LPAFASATAALWNAVFRALPYDDLKALLDEERGSKAMLL